MNKPFWILDTRDVWYKAAIKAANARGYAGKRIMRGSEAVGGVSFIRPHADPNVLEMNQIDYYKMAASSLCVQDTKQVSFYEDKYLQWLAFKDFMPKTWRFCSLTEALVALPNLPDVLISKADVGASSANVRYLKGRAEIEKHIRQVFGKGIAVNHCSGGYMSRQRDYVMLQEFIPHEVTWRVNIVGTQCAVFKRHCYADKPLAETGNTKAVTEMSDDVAFLLHTARNFFRVADTRWCAADFLKTPNGWLLLETSLAWPWSVGSYADCPFWTPANQPYHRSWGDIWDVLFNEIEAGVWG